MGQKQVAKTEGKDRGQRQRAETRTAKISCYILLTSPIIAYQAFTFTSSVKRHGKAFYSPITEVLAFLS
jgi:hypothetical protein